MPAGAGSLAGKQPPVLHWQGPAPMTETSRSDDHEVLVAYRGHADEGGKPDGRAGAIAIRIVVEHSRIRVVQDEVVGIPGGATPACTEMIRRLGADSQLGEDLAADQSLRIENGHAFTRDPVTTRTLNLELSNAIRASRGDGSELAGVILLRRPGRQPLMFLTAPLRLATTTQGAALVFVFDPENRPSITSGLIRRLFGLSVAEAELAVALCAGKTLDDAASERGTSIHTV